jgi:hypothetical protein
MRTCNHSPTHAYMLAVSLDDDAAEAGAEAVNIRFCMFDDCREWIIRRGDESVEGAGLSAYRDAVLGLANQYADWDAAFFYDLGGHAPEMES